MLEKQSEKQRGSLRSLFLVHAMHHAAVSSRSLRLLTRAQENKPS